jgi:hypothetical protein
MPRQAVFLAGALLDPSTQSNLGFFLGRRGQFPEELHRRPHITQRAPAEGQKRQGEGLVMSAHDSVGKPWGLVSGMRTVFIS